MGRFGFVGPSYTSQSPNADAEKTLNWYIEAIEGSGKSGLAMYPSPGLKVWATVAEAEVRAEYTINGRFFAVCGGGFYEFSSTGVPTKWGPVLDDHLPAYIVSSATQVLISSGGTVYVFTLATNTFIPVPASVITNVAQVAYADGFFFGRIANSQEIFQSFVEDPTTWPGVNFSAVSVFPDNLNAMLVDHREVWLFSAKATAPYYDAGDFPFAYDVVPGGFIEQGCAAAGTPVKADNSVFWLGQDERGAGIFWRANGYVPVRVSNHAVEAAWASYSNISDAISYSYQDQGHTFIVLYFPTPSKTWVYDIATNSWSERAYWDSKNAVFTAHRSRCHAYCFGMHLVGDWASGTIYQMSTAILNDFGSLIRRLRRAPHISTEQQWIFHKQMQIDLETGLGPVPPLLDGSGKPRDPQVVLRWSDDGGHTWSNDHTRGAGQAGQYKKRVIWRVLGRSRDRIYEMEVSDPIPWRIVDAYLEADPAFAPQERLASQYRKVS